MSRMVASPGRGGFLREVSSMRVLTVHHIPIRLHGSFLVLATMLLGWELLRGGPVAALGALVLGVAIFGSVLLHELGHALAGRLYGIETRDITLYPFGGVARMAGARLAPVPELVVSLAGPAVNFILAGLALALAGLEVPVARELAVLNIVLGVFNLLPAFPMDGGRVLRAVLSLRMDPVRATLRALQLSRVFAWLFVIAGPLSGSWSLALVGGLLLLAGRQERRRWEELRHLQDAGALPRRVATPTPEQIARLPFGHPVR